MRDPIKDMYKTVFDDYTVNKDSGEWEAMENRIQKQNFLYFRWTQFNIYYAVSIITTLFLSSAIAGHYFYSHFIKENSTRKSEIAKHIEDDKPLSIKKQSNSSSKNIVKVFRSPSVSSEHIQNKVSNPALSVSPEEGSISASEEKTSESSLNVTESNTGESSKAPFIKVQKVVIVKQDTIHRVDTIKTKGRFWKKH